MVALSCVGGNRFSLDEGFPALLGFLWLMVLLGFVVFWGFCGFLVGFGGVCCGCWFCGCSGASAYGALGVSVFTLRLPGRCLLRYSGVVVLFEL